MINVPENVKNIFYNDNSKKRLVLSTNPNWIYDEDIEYQKNMDELNLFNGNAYTSSFGWHYNFTNSPFTDSDYVFLKINRYSNIDSYDATDSVETFAFKYRNYVNVSMDIGIKPTNPIYSTRMRFGVIYEDNAGIEHEEDVVFNVNDYLVESEFALAGRVSVTIPTYKLSAIGAYSIKRIVWRSIDNNVDFYGYLIFNSPIISVSDNPDSFPIPYSRIDYTTLDKTEYIPFMLFDNDDIEYEKFSMTESLCSRDNIEFGLCEAAKCEVTLINDIHTVKDEILYAQLLINNPNSYDIPSFNVLRRINWYKGSRYNPSPAHNTARWENVTANHITNSRIGDIDIALYNEYFLEYPYLYIKYNLSFEFFTADSLPTYIRPRWYFEKSNGVTYTVYGDYIELSELLNNSVENLHRLINENDTGSIDKFTKVEFYLFDANKDALTVSNINARVVMDNVQVGLLNTLSDEIPSFSLDTCYVYNGTLDQYLATHNEYGISLGKFNVKEVQNNISYDLIRKTLIMYDDMIFLEQNAANWYTHYMYGISTNEASPYGYEFARQIYSSYYNYMRTTGTVSESAEMTQILTKTYGELESTMSTKNVPFLKLYYESTKELHNTGILYYAYVDIADPNPQKLYSVKWFNYQYQSEVYVPWYYMHDKYNRGLENANILVEEHLSDGSYNKFLVDPDDLFALSPTCTQLKLYVPMYAKYTSFADKYYLLDHIEVYTTDKNFDLENASARLLYYDYNLKEVEFEEADEDWPGNVIDRCISHTIFECDSNITGRDVIHSLLELTGCFFRMSRKTGEPEFIYCTKSGLYPSNTLYPADDLYPRRGTNQVASMGTYISTEYADYTVTKFGKIQILKNQTSNDAESNVQWQYAGDEDVGLNTYIIDDNIFYCNKDMTYDTEHMQELDKVLEKMYYRISNMDYVPNTTEALGMPWIECGDRVGLLTAIGGFETFIYRRTLKGIQGLFDVYESRGDEYNNAISNYGY